jgi:replication fork clamp-binding protein CrfC
VILAVVPANQDMATSDSLQIARQLDPEGKRTLGVITKIDIMDKGTDARQMLSNEEIPLALGYVGVKGRSQQDINDKVKVAEA